MAVNSTHPDYDARAAAWSRARDVLAGEDAVKAAGQKYLPRLDSQTDEEYAAYKARASFFGATGRTLEEYLDIIFRRAPVTSLPDSDQLKAFAQNCDGSGTSFVRFARRVVSEVLSVGRAGTLVLPQLSTLNSQPPSGHQPSTINPSSQLSTLNSQLPSQLSTLNPQLLPHVSLWKAEDILNWGVERVSGRSVLVSVVLKDGELVRILQLIGSECFQEVWAQVEGGWSLQERSALKRDGVSLSFIPFAFHGPRHSLPEPDRLPLADIIVANLDHYRLDADYKHGLHFAALPTAWVSGFDKATALRIGSSTAWVSEVPGATAGFLEFRGAGLSHLERAMDKVEQRMVLLGARMLEAKDVATLSGNRDLCGLGSIVAALNESLSQVLKLAQWWIKGGEVDSQSASFTMNTDLSARAMSGEEITAVVEAWRTGAISRDTMLERLKRGEVLPDGRSVAQERALIHRSTSKT